MNKFLLGFFTIVLLSGCVNQAAFTPLSNEERDFIYDYQTTGKTKKETYNSARYFFATIYGDSKEITRIEDEEQGLIIAKALTRWHMDTGMIIVPCVSAYSIHFIAKDDKARLKLSIIDSGARTPECGWTLPSKQGYPDVVANLNLVAKELGKSITGKSELEQLSDF